MIDDTLYQEVWTKGAYGRLKRGEVAYRAARDRFVKLHVRRCNLLREAIDQIDQEIESGRHSDENAELLATHRNHVVWDLDAMTREIKGLRVATECEWMNGLDRKGA